MINIHSVRTAALELIEEIMPAANAQQRTTINRGVYHGSSTGIYLQVYLFVLGIPVVSTYDTTLRSKLTILTHRTTAKSYISCMHKKAGCMKIIIIVAHVVLGQNIILIPTVGRNIASICLLQSAHHVAQYRHCFLCKSDSPKAFIFV